MSIPKFVIIDLLENYNKHKAILLQLQLEDDVSIVASIIRDTPRSQTNKFYSITESLAMWKPEQEQLKRNIKLVDIWIESLSHVHAFILEKVYKKKYTYYMLTEEWKKMFGDVHNKVYWSEQRKKAIETISKQYELQKHNDCITNQ